MKAMTASLPCRRLPRFCGHLPFLDFAPLDLEVAFSIPEELLT
jgi:hypothetical protein